MSKSKIVTYASAGVDRNVNCIAVPFNVLVFSAIIFVFLLPTIIVSYRTYDKGVLKEVLSKEDSFDLHKKEAKRFEEAVKRIDEYETQVKHYELNLKTKALELTKIVQHAKKSSFDSNPDIKSNSDKQPKSWRERLGLGGGEDILKNEKLLKNNNSKKQNDFCPKNTELAALLDDLKTNIAELPIGAPAIGRISSEYGIRKSPFEKDVLQRHSAIDIAAKVGTKVHVTAPGKVLKTGYSSTLGNFVIVEHKNKIITRYGHLSKIHAVEGKHISRGQLIGEIGSTGRSTGAHLHYEIIMEEKQVNPLFLINLANDIAKIWNL